MNLYQKYILPRFLNLVLKKKDKDPERADTACHAHGVVLEIGFGSGLNMQFYQNVTKLYALDPSRELFNLAHDRIDAVPFPVEYIEASAEKIPLPDNSIDAVVSTWSLCSIPHPDKALREVARVLKNGGTFAFVDHGLSSHRCKAWWQKFLTPAWKRIAGGCHMDRKIDALITDAGFTITNIDMFQKNSIPLGHMYKGTAMMGK